MKNQVLKLMAISLAVCGWVSCGGDVDNSLDPDNPETPEVHLSCPDNNHPHLIDLGLPSGTKWACCNIGASAPEKYGGYFAWGETASKSYYDLSTYTHCEGSNSTWHHIGDNIAGTEYDVAHVKWDESWRMPSLDQIKELIDNCTRTWTTQNGVKGILVTGANGGAIFMPAAGRIIGDHLYEGGMEGCYWSSSLGLNNKGYAYRLYFDAGVWGRLDSNRRDGGQSVRAVCP